MASALSGEQVPATGGAAAIADGRQVERVPELDGLRGAAALVVVIHHCLLTQPAYSDFFFSRWRDIPSSGVAWWLTQTPLRIVWSGYEAVILFYVLSGLVLALPWLHGRAPTYGVYAVKRVCRIYLPYIVSIAFAAVLDVALHFRQPIPGLSDWVNGMNWSNPVTASTLINHLLITGHHNNVNGPIHSLVWELRISALFPILMLPVVARGTRGVIAAALVLAGVVGACQAVWGTQGPWELLANDPDAGLAGRFAYEVQWTAYFGLFFLAGITLARAVYRRGVELPRLPRAAPLIAVAAGLLIIQAHWSEHEMIQDVMVGVGSAVLILACRLPGAPRNVMRGRVAAWLGEISYAVYLVHVPLLLALTIVTHGILPLWLLILVTVPSSVALGWLFDTAIVKPCAALGRRLARLSVFRGGHVPGMRERHMA